MIEIRSLPVLGLAAFGMCFMILCGIDGWVVSSLTWSCLLSPESTSNPLASCSMCVFEFGRDALRVTVPCVFLLGAEASGSASPWSC